MSSDTSTYQIYHRSNHLTLSERKNENFQSIEKISMDIYFLNAMVGLENTDPITREESKYFFLTSCYYLLILLISKFLSF